MPCGRIEQRLIFRDFRHEFKPMSRYVATVEECIKLPIHHMVRGALPAGRTVGWRWTGPGEGSGFTMWGRVTAEDPGGSRLVIGREWPDVFQTIELDPAAQRFGGVRWLAVCPGCDGRVAKLYLPPGRGRFLCAPCWPLTYQSRRETRSGSEREYRRLFRDLARRWAEASPS